MKALLAKSITEAIDDIASYTKSRSEGIRELMYWQAKLDDKVLEEYAEDISSVYTYTDACEIRLKEDRRDSKLVHKLAQVLGVKFNKEKSWSGTLHAIGRLPDGHTITVFGYVPSACTLTYVEEPIPEDQIVRSRKRAVVTCIE